MYGESTRGFDPRTIDGSQVPDDLGRQSVGVGAACASTLGDEVGRAQRSSSIPSAMRPRRRPTSICSSTPAPTARSPSPCCMPSARPAASIASFLAAHAKGWDEIERQLRRMHSGLGRSNVTGVPARLIERSGTSLRSGPVACCGWARASSARPSAATPCARSGCLPAATGNIGKYGAGFLYLNGWDTRGVDPAYLAAAHLKQESGAVRSATWISQAA